MEFSAIEIIGYIASIVIALSMTMNSIVKFRWINLIGAITFSTYGFIMGAYPVGFLNAFIVSVDIYYLIKIYSKKETFEILEVRPDNRYLLRFIEFHNPDILKHFPGFEYKPELNTLSFLILRNMSVAGVFLSHKEDDNTLRVGLDYVIPEYRDFKNGKYIYYRLKNRFIQSGIKSIVADGNSKTYSVYLKKQGFKETRDGFFEKDIS